MQRLKPLTRQRILTTALGLFATQGVEQTTMAAIAQAAGLSIGNLYRYFPSKESLASAVLPAELAASLKRLIRARVEALFGVTEVAALPRDAAYFQVAGELLDLCVTNRERVILLFTEERAPRFAHEVTRLLEALAAEYAASIDPEFKPTPEWKASVHLIYQAFVANLVTVLKEHTEPHRIRAITECYLDYHLAGMRQLTAPSRPERPHPIVHQGARRRP